MTADDLIDAALREQRQFVITLGGYGLEIPGATLVTHERVPVPRFNFVQDVRVGPERQAAFFERALDHYFQRALRPTFRVRVPAPPHLDLGLRRYGFVPRADPWTLFLAPRTGVPGATSNEEIVVGRADPAAIDEVVPFWVGREEETEFRRSIEVVWNHPNPDESLVPLLAWKHDEPVAAALLYRSGRDLGLHALATQPGARDQGAATALVTHALAHEVPEDVRTVSIESESLRLDEHLVRMGFRTLGRWTSYELPAEAQLTLPDPGPAQPPRWRPPREKSSG